MKEVLRPNTTASIPSVDMEPHSSMPSGPRPADDAWLSTVRINVDRGKQTKIRVGKRDYGLWWSDRWGPAACNRDGDIIDNQPPPRSFFYTAACLWDAQGRRVDSDGFAIWEREPQPTFYVRREGRRNVIVRIEGDLPKIERERPNFVFLDGGAA